MKAPETQHEPVDAKLASSHLELLKMALCRLEDILEGDDGQAYKEARKFVEQARKVVPSSVALGPKSRVNN